MSSKETEGVSSRTKFTSVFETLVILIGLIYRWSIALHPYSGQGKEPMFGDYEAQRHWMEITFNLPIKEWYVNSTRNDLNYWGLDYPPLTAYHSYVMGYIANIVDESYVKLSDSRGIENNQHKLFMRMSVLISDLVVFLPAVLLITRKLVKSSTNDYLILLLLVLLNPTLTLVDYGHFQYNSVSLGLMLLALYFILSLDKQPLCKIKLSIASVFFTLALNYKQMELYHALPFFFFLLGSSLFRSTSISNGLYKLIVIGSSVLLTFLIVWLPFILSQSALDVLKRLFPFDRGLYEDKVANLWCSLSPVYKLKELYSIATLRNICTITTLGAVIPSSVDLFFRPSRQRFLFALVNSALVFFLFSYHVHEKSILLATVPALFLINFYPAIVTWFIFIANFSMLPLLHKDGLFTAFVSTTAVFIAIAYLYYNSNSSNDKQQQRREIGFWPNFKQLALFQVTFKSLFYLSMVASVALTFGFLFVRPPKNLPDLWPLLISVFSFVHFVAFSLLFHWTQFTLVYDDLSSKKQPTLMDFSSQLSSKPKQKNL